MAVEFHVDIQSWENCKKKYYGMLFATPCTSYTHSEYVVMKSWH